MSYLWGSKYLYRFMRVGDRKLLLLFPPQVRFCEYSVVRLTLHQLLIHIIWVDSVYLKYADMNWCKQFQAYKHGNVWYFRECTLTWITVSLSAVSSAAVYSKSAEVWMLTSVVSTQKCRFESIWDCMIQDFGVICYFQFWCELCYGKSRQQHSRDFQFCNGLFSWEM